jgi:hypothetical protein
MGGPGGHHAGQPGPDDDHLDWLISGFHHLFPASNFGFLIFL